MKANELRIGNFYQENGVIRTVTVNDLVNLIRHEGTKFKSDMESITLTEEWLLKFGFKKTITAHGGILYKKEINKTYSKLVVCDFGAGLSVDLTTVHGSLFVIGQINFVHSLQNLYFALTGEELTIK